MSDRELKLFELLQAEASRLYELPFLERQPTTIPYRQIADQLTQAMGEPVIVFPVPVPSLFAGGGEVAIGAYFLPRVRHNIIAPLAPGEEDRRRGAIVGTCTHCGKVGVAQNEEGCEGARASKGGA